MTPQLPFKYIEAIKQSAANWLNFNDACIFLCLKNVNAEIKTVEKLES